MWCYLILGMASMILFMAPSDSIDKTDFNMFLCVTFTIGIVVFPISLALLYRSQKEKHMFRQQRLKMTLFFAKRVVFVLLTFFI
jgi:hypothetical protein